MYGMMQSIGCKAAILRCRAVILWQPTCKRKSGCYGVTALQTTEIMETSKRLTAKTRLAFFCAFSQTIGNIFMFYQKNVFLPR